MPRDAHAYAGATAPLTLDAARRLGPRWVIQEKKDGMYCRLYLDSRGRVARAFTRQGLEVARSLLGPIWGAHLGRPHAELVGELEAYTDASVAAIAERGHPVVHLFDCVHDGARSLVRDPYRARRDALYRMTSEVECYGPRPEAAPRDVQGRYSARRLLGWQLAPIVPQAPLRELERLWGDVVVDGEGEGLVAVNLDAPAGARAAKRKVKPWDTIDCLAVSADDRLVDCLWAGHRFVVHKPRRLHVEAGNTVAVRHSGWYDRGCTPKFPVLVGVRRDLLL